MSTKIRVVTYTLAVLLIILIVILLVDMRQDSAGYVTDNTEAVYVTDTVDLDEKVEQYLSTTEVNEQLSINTIGSIYVNGALDYPLMYSSDIAYYTQHDCYDNPSKEGAIFLDSRITEYDNRVLLVHGLTTETNSMFSVLSNYLDSTWATQHNQLQVNLLELKNYKLFSVITLDEQESLIQLNCDSDSVYKNFFETLSSQSIIPFECEFSVDKQIVILNTVTLDGRYVLVCFLEEV